MTLAEWFLFVCGAAVLVLAPFAIGRDARFDPGRYRPRAERPRDRINRRLFQIGRR